MYWSSFSSRCCSSLTCFSPYARGDSPFRIARPAAVPAACPSVKIVASTRTLPSAMCVTLWQRPANMRFGTLRE